MLLSYSFSPTEISAITIKEIYVLFSTINYKNACKSNDSLHIHLLLYRFYPCNLVSFFIITDERTIRSHCRAITKNSNPPNELSRYLRGTSINDMYLP